MANFFRTLASSVATAVSTTLYSHRTIYHHAVLTAHIEAGERTATTYLEALKQIGLQTQSADATINRLVDMQAATLAINDVFLCFGMIFGIAMIAIWFAKPPFKSGGGSG
jgi:DHA2 family multidrug resistance protein